MLLHRSDRVLLQKRTHDAPRHADKWGSFGGHGEAGETPESAAIREIREELALELAPSDLQLVIAVPVSVGRFSGLVHYFSAPLTAPLSDLRLGEGAGFALLSRQEVKGLYMVQHTRLALHQFFASQ